MTRLLRDNLSVGVAEYQDIGKTRGFHARCFTGGRHCARPCVWWFPPYRPQQSRHQRPHSAEFAEEAPSSRSSSRSREECYAMSRQRGFDHDIDEWFQSIADQPGRQDLALKQDPALRQRTGGGCPPRSANKRRAWALPWRVPARSFLRPVFRRYAKPQTRLPQEQNRRDGDLPGYDRQRASRPGVRPSASAPAGTGRDGGCDGYAGRREAGAHPVGNFGPVIGGFLRLPADPRILMVPVGLALIAIDVPLMRSLRDLLLACDGLVYRRARAQRRDLRRSSHPGRRPRAGRNDRRFRFRSFFFAPTLRNFRRTAAVLQREVAFVR